MRQIRYLDKLVDELIRLTKTAEDVSKHPQEKAVCILLTLLTLGIKNIYVGPTLPAFFSEAVVKFLVDAYHLHPVTSSDQDMKAMLRGN